jgi:hypothetical protein
MKAIQIGGAIKRYTTIPKSWGNVICGFDLLGSDTWEEAGFYDVVTPDYDSATQKLGDLEWDADSSTFTYPVINKTWTQTVAELKESKIANLKYLYNRKLSETDWYIIRSQEGTSAPQDVLDARAALRTECATKEGEINALTTKKAVASYSLPSLDI